jgi:hypothetical protein
MDAQWTRLQHLPPLPRSREDDPEYYAAQLAHRRSLVEWTPPPVNPILDKQEQGRQQPRTPLDRPRPPAPGTLSKAPPTRVPKGWLAPSPELVAVRAIRGSARREAPPRPVLSAAPPSDGDDSDAWGKQWQGGKPVLQPTSPAGPTYQLSEVDEIVEPRVYGSQRAHLRRRRGPKTTSAASSAAVEEIAREDIGEAGEEIARKDIAGGEIAREDIGETGEEIARDEEIANEEIAADKESGPASADNDRLAPPAWLTPVLGRADEDDEAAPDPGRADPAPADPALAQPCRFRIRYKRADLAPADPAPAQSEDDDPAPGRPERKKPRLAPPAEADQQPQPWQRRPQLSWRCKGYARILWWAEYQRRREAKAWAEYLRRQEAAAWGSNSGVGGWWTAGLAWW